MTESAGVRDSIGERDSVAGPPIEPGTRPAAPEAPPREGVRVTRGTETCWAGARKEAKATVNSATSSRREVRFILEE